MRFWKDKEGNELTFKQFIERWKSGIEGITPQQKLKTQLTGTRITLLGIICGLGIAIYGWKNLWWVALILLGAFLNTWIQYVSLKQQMKVFENNEKLLVNEEPMDLSEIEEQLKGGTK